MRKKPQPGGRGDLTLIICWDKLYTVMAINRRILAALALLLALVPDAGADISGSGLVVESPTTPLPPGQYVDLSLKITNASSDLNWIARVDLRLPACCTVVAMSYEDSTSTGNWVFEMEGLPGSNVSYVDGAGDEWGEIPGGDFGYLNLIVHVNVTCSAGPAEIFYDLHGDGFGAEPHILLDLALPIEFSLVPAATSDWSTVKSLY